MEVLSKVSNETRGLIICGQVTLLIQAAANTGSGSIIRSYAVRLILLSERTMSTM